MNERDKIDLRINLENFLKDYDKTLGSSLDDHDARKFISDWINKRYPEVNDQERRILDRRNIDDTSQFIIGSLHTKHLTDLLMQFLVDCAEKEIPLEDMNYDCGKLIDGWVDKIFRWE
jgi:hypothetical protein